jgi:preprotein translocase subunit SecE
MSNRAVRRQQLKEPKSNRGARNPARSIATPRTAPSGRATQSRGAWYRPRWIMDIISELKKVVWPSRSDVWHLTVVVVIVTLIVGAVLGGIDIGFGQLIDRTLLSN